MGKGKYYENKAVEYLKLKGYKIIETNFRTRWGEIDIIGRDKNHIALIEVKARKINSLVSFRESIDNRKQHKLELAAKIYCKKRPYDNYRFDVVGIEDGGGYRRYELIKGAFFFGERRNY